MRNALFLAVGVFCCLSLAVEWTGQTCIAQETDRAEKREARRGRFKAAPWELLLFREQITSVSIILHERDAVFGKRGVAGESPLRYESQDPDFLNIMHTFLWMPLRPAFPDTMKGGIGGGDITFLLGEMTVTTGEDQFVVVITSKGFTLGRSSDLLRHRFHSWGLAKLIDDILFEQNQVRLPAEVFSILSGESHIAYHKRRYATFLEKQRQGQSEE